MRVGLLTREFPPEIYGGAGVHVEYLSQELARLVDVDVHAFGSPRTSLLVAASYEPWDVLPTDQPESAVLQTMSVDLAMAAGIKGVDLVHSHTWYTNLAGHWARLLYDVPHVATAHSLEPMRPWKAEQLAGGYRLSSWCEGIGLEGADAVIAVSAGMRDDILNCYPSIDPNRVKVIHNGIDPDEYWPDTGTEHLVELGVDPNQPFVLFVGRITHQKGVTYLIDALARVESSAQVVLLAGQPDTAELAVELKTKVDELSRRRPGVIWIDHMLARSVVVQLMAQAAVFVCPSIYEPFGLINVEAMACGTPVVASAVGGIPEIVEHGKTGYLVRFEAANDTYGSPADPGRFATDLAARIDELLADQEKAKQMGEAGRARAMAKFAWPQIAAQTVDLYRSLLG